MKVFFTKSDFHSCYKFGVMYFLDDTKPKENRTTGQYRGLGAIINDFFLGKLIEIGVKKAIDKYNKKIKCKLDFSLHTLSLEHQSDPDIIGVIENKKERHPGIFIEIKNVSESDRYVGLKQGQLQSMLKNKTIDINRNLNKLFIINGCIKTKNRSKIADVFGAYLRAKIDDKLLNDFSRINEIFLDIRSIITGSELMWHGTRFRKNSYFYETQIVRENESFENKEAENIRSSGYKRKRLNNGYLPIIMRDNYPEPKEFGKFSLRGKINLFIKSNRKSKRAYIDCLSKVIIKNKVLGDFCLKKGKMYELYFNTIGRKPQLNDNNIWIANRNLNNIIRVPAKQRLQYIAKHI